MHVFCSDVACCNVATDSCIKFIAKKPVAYIFLLLADEDIGRNVYISFHLAMSLRSVPILYSAFQNTGGTKLVPLLLYKPLHQLYPIWREDTILCTGKLVWHTASFYVQYFLLQWIIWHLIGDNIV